jgi:hypothetical protein
MNAITWDEKHKQLPQEIIDHIYCFGGGHRERMKSVLEELTGFIPQLNSRDKRHYMYFDCEQIYIYKKPNTLNPETSCFALIDYNEKLNRCIFSTVEKWYTGDRTTHVLSFNQAILHLKHHSTGYYDEEKTNPITWTEYEE